eukprot:3235437-Rhodomonas_salina.2
MLWEASKGAAELTSGTGKERSEVVAQMLKGVNLDCHSNVFQAAVECLGYKRDGGGQESPEAEEDGGQLGGLRRVELRRRAPGGEVLPAQLEGAQQVVNSWQEL